MLLRKGTRLRSLAFTISALALLAAGTAGAEPYYPSNAADFVVPIDELDAVAVSQAAVRTGFRPLGESDPKLQAGRSAPDPVRQIWELPSHKIASITLVKTARTNRFVVLFTAKDEARRGSPLSGEACKRWLRFSDGLRIEFGQQQSKFRFRYPQCTP